MENKKKKMKRVYNIKEGAKKFSRTLKLMAKLKVVEAFLENVFYSF